MSWPGQSGAEGSVGTVGPRAPQEMGHCWGATAAAFGKNQTDVSRAGKHSSKNGDCKNTAAFCVP